MQQSSDQIEAPPSNKKSERDTKTGECAGQAGRTILTTSVPPGMTTTNVGAGETRRGNNAGMRMTPSAAPRRAHVRSCWTRRWRCCGWRWGSVRRPSSDPPSERISAIGYKLYHHCSGQGCDWIGWNRMAIHRENIDVRGVRAAGWIRTLIHVYDVPRMLFIWPGIPLPGNACLECSKR